ncbi:unnamed protein product [Acanthoscelides obtectus]|uniref:Guanylate kinase-like domain-containing protein n=1 Tax=Acanthoscelides obtectus TaxID=200917 RepID=A0A9P0KI26_ACAOB|nr:unnamed protein product [Acanthoscelides obtectus]CAK1646737.1 Leucine-rich repeat and guanylate kinase domain-containing protein [Acanthoscelides obtectus]
MSRKCEKDTQSNNSLLNYFAVLDNASQISSPIPSQIKIPELLEDDGSSESEGEMFKSDTHVRVLEGAGDWKAHRFSEEPFPTRKGEVRMRNFNDLKLNDEELNGVLSQRMIAWSISNLQRVPELNFYAYVKLSLEAKELTDITAIKKYHFIQYLDLSFNKLTTLQPLGDLPFLQYLYVSHNELENLLDFKAPFYLTYVNFSYNHVKKMPDLKDFWSLVHLDLCFNEIEKIEGIESLRFLSHLDLSHNKIQVVENISNLRLQTLLIRSNMIDTIEEEGKGVGISTLHLIRTIDLTYNNISSLRYFEGCYNLETLIIAANKIGAHVVPCDFPPPPIILLAGPPGSRKKEIAFEFAMKNPKAVLGVSHTTRQRNAEEVDGRHYYFVDENKFDYLLKHGEFMTVSESYGFRYGISFRELAKATTENKVLVFYTDLSAALMLKLMNMCPKIVLALPKREKTHLNWLKEKYIYQFINRDLVLIRNCPACVREVKAVELSTEGSTVSSESTIASTDQNTSPASHDYLHSISGYIEGAGFICLHSRNCFTMGQKPSYGKELNEMPAGKFDIVNKESHVSQCKTCCIGYTDASTETTERCDKCVQCDTLAGSSVNSKRDVHKGISFNNSLDSFEKTESDWSDPLQDVIHKSVSDSYLLQVTNSSKSANITHRPLLSVLSKAQVHVNETDSAKQETIYMTATETFDMLQQEHLKVFLEDVMDNRQQLLELHNENIGLFRDVIFTDEIDDALRRLKNILKYTIKNHIISKEDFNIKEDPVYKKMIDKKLKKIGMLQNVHSKKN